MKAFLYVVLAVICILMLTLLSACFGNSPRPPAPSTEAPAPSFDRAADVVSRLDTFARGAERLAASDPDNAGQWLRIAGGVRSASNIIAATSGNGYDQAVAALLEVTGVLGGRYALYAAGAALVLDLLRPYDSVHPPQSKDYACSRLSASAFEHVLADASR
jgi:ABC-type Fe3+-hydroxamate transport system substrate-binding protein